MESKAYIEPTQLIYDLLEQKKNIVPKIAVNDECNRKGFFRIFSKILAN